MQWINERESLRVGSKTYGYGDEVPLEQIPTEMIERLKKAKQLGAIPEAYDPGKHFSERVKELEAETLKLKKEIKELKSAAKTEKEKSK